MLKACGKDVTISLNPCFSGCWSRTHLCRGRACPAGAVLILVLVDVGLGLEHEIYEYTDSGVLILVLVDVGLGRYDEIRISSC